MNEVQKQVKNIASKGRYGDSMLMHVNPMEVNAIAQQVPLTINPETGQPEAFLPFLAPILGSMAGGALLTGLGGAGVAGAGLSSLAAVKLGAKVTSFDIDENSIITTKHLKSKFYKKNKITIFCIISISIEF